MFFDLGVHYRKRKAKVCFTQGPYGRPSMNVPFTPTPKCHPQNNDIDTVFCHFLRNFTEVTGKGAQNH